MKHRVGGLSRQNQTTLKVNPSLLSVISGLTAISDSSSNATITQQSYNSRSSNNLESNIVHRRSYSTPIPSRSQIPDVFAYMDSASSDGDDHDDRSESSSQHSSHYSPSDAGSDDTPQTPSSNSTFPSPTATRNGSLTGSVTESRKKYDAQVSSPIDSPMNSRHGSEAGSEGIEKHRRRGSNSEHEANHNASSGHSQDSRDEVRSRSARSQERQGLHLDARQHGFPHQQSYPGQHLVQPMYGQNRSHSTSSADSAGSYGAYAQYMAMQQYQHPSAPASYLAPQQGPGGSVEQSVPPPVPDAPDLSQRTVAGYEMLAQELASSESPVKPVYRKFEYLNHRILLHLQDELCEMEEQLRTTDEIIAQMEMPAEDGCRLPASRRGDAFRGSDMHHRRTALLGRIFLKTEQYNRAMSSYATLKKDSRPADMDRVTAYREWMAEKAPIHHMEAKFLRNEQDLVQPGKEESTQSATIQQHPSRHAAALSCLPAALMLPLLLYSIIPTLAGRLIITMLIGIGVFLVAATTRIRHMMPLNEWAVCGGAYVLIMAAIAGCIPQHAA